jgi:hypothetical protein
MAICKYCQQEMNGAAGCVKMPVRTIEGNLDPIPYGSEQQHPPAASGQHHHGVLLGSPPRCHDCDVLAGHYHHPGCDWEECPRCHGQLIGCDCDPKTIAADEEDL